LVSYSQTKLRTKVTVIRFYSCRNKLGVPKLLLAQLPANFSPKSCVWEATRWPLSRQYEISDNTPTVHTTHPRHSAC